MEPSAWILAGGQSRRMGQDKARLLFAGEPLLVRTANLLRPLAPELHVLAPPDRYLDLGFTSTPDLRPHLGPLSGIEAALAATHSDWNWIVACDMPYLEASWLRLLFEEARHSNPDCVVSNDPQRGINPLCALWHRRSLPAVQAALDAQRLRVRDLVAQLNTRILTPADPKILANWNEPNDIRKE